MRNLKPFTGDCFAVHIEAVERKEDDALKTRLRLISRKIEEQFRTYRIAFDTGFLRNVCADTSISSSKDDLMQLYGYQTRTIRTFREQLIELQPRTIIATCQQCGIDSVSTLDHFLPKSKFPEFVVNPINLIPCCNRCNGYKMVADDDGTGSDFLNLYLDILPDEQYLFVDVRIDKYGELDFEFYLDDSVSQIDAKLFQVIDSHYRKLRLFERMRVKSVEYVSELETRILSFLPSLTMESIVETLLDAVEDDQRNYGYNHWKCIVELALLRSTDFLNLVRARTM